MADKFDSLICLVFTLGLDSTGPFIASKEQTELPGTAMAKHQTLSFPVSFLFYCKTDTILKAILFAAVQWV